MPGICGLTAAPLSHDSRACPESAGSASFGASRDFMLRHNARRDRKLRFPLGDGDVLIMSGET